jgi:predicted transport protein
MIEKDLNVLETGLLYVDHYVQVGSGIIDTLAIDEDKNPVVIEYKVEEGEDETALLQTLSYANWVYKNPDSILRFIREKELGTSFESLGDVRIIIVAPSFNDRTKQAAEMVEPDIVLRRYLVFDIPSLGKRLHLETIRDSRTRARPGLSPTAYTIDYHFEGNYIKMRPLFDRLANEARKLGADLTIEPKKWYIAFRRNYNLAIVNVYTTKLEVGMPVPSPEQDPRMMDITKWGFSRILYGIVLKDEKDIDEKLLKWLKASYEAS